MREAIGSSLLLNIAIVFIGVISAFLISSIAYSKAYKVKNRIVSIIEKFDGQCNFEGYGTDNCTIAIENDLNAMGYSSNINSTCPGVEYSSENEDILSVALIYDGFDTGHKYCIYKYEMCDYTNPYGNSRVCSQNSSVLYYYKVKTFMHFDIPLIGQFLEFPVSGETKTFYDTFVNVIE